MVLGHRASNVSRMCAGLRRRECNHAYQCKRTALLNEASELRRPSIG